jgi:nucleoside 2-deoxyribosyltransferase
MSDFSDRSRSLARDRYWEKHPREDYNCPDCGRGQDDIIGKFHVHHKSRNPHDNRLDQLIGLCGFCHKLREDKKPSLKRIKRFQKQDNRETVNAEKTEIQHRYPRIYTAGRMVYENNEDSRYRAAIDLRFESKDKARFLHPTDTYFDHGGEPVNGCVAEDIEMIDKSDGIIAFFDEKGQTGTLTELFHALRTDTPALVLLSEGDIIGSRTRSKFTDTPRPVGRLSMRCQSQLWFLINYLNGDKTDSPHDPSWIDKSWDGTDVTTVAVSKGDGSIEATVESWIDNNLQSVDYSNIGPDEVEKASKIADPGESDPEVLSDE